MLAFVELKQELCMHLFQINHLINYQKFTIKFYFLKTFNLEFSYFQEWFIDKNFTLLEIVDK